MDIEDVKKPAPARKPAKEYKFVLDPFQAAAVGCLEKGQSVRLSLWISEQIPEIQTPHPKPQTLGETPSRGWGR